MLRCTACGSSICGRECAEKRWKMHRTECRRLQAVAFGEDYARQHVLRFSNAASHGDVKTMKGLAIGLSGTVARTKFSKAMDGAMRAFADSIDPRWETTAAYRAAEFNNLEAVRLLHELRADLGKPNTVDGATPAIIAAQNGHTAMVQLLHDLGADVHRAVNDGARPIHLAADGGHAVQRRELDALRHCLPGGCRCQGHRGAAPSLCGRFEL